MNGATVFQMVSGLGDAFGGAYSDARKQAQEEEAPTLISNLMSAYKGGGAVSAPPSGLGGPAGSPAASGPVAAAPTFAATGGGMGDYLATTRAKESGGNDAAANPNSTALGRYQFTKGTWAGLAKQYPDLGLTPNGRTDPAQQERAMQAFTRDNARALTSAGIPINPTNLYGAHFLGASGASKFIPGALNSPDAPAASLVGPGVASANRTVFFNRDGSPKTAGEVYAWMGGRRGGGSAPAQTQVAAAPQIAPPQRSSVAVANNEPDVQALEREMGMLPSVPRQVASAEPDAANIPAVSAQPVGFVIPQGGAPAAAPSQGFSGFPAGAGARMTPELQTALNAAWRNPNTRAMAGQIFGQLLKGQDSGWDLKDVNGQSAWVNTRDGRILPIGQAKRNTATVGNSLVDTATGDVLFTAPDKDSSKLLNVPAGTTVLDPVTRQPIYTAPRAERDEGDKVRDQVAAREQEAKRLGLEPGTPKFESYVLTSKIGRDQELSATDKKAIMEAEESVLSAQNAIEALNQAKTISPKAYVGPTAGIRGYATSLVGSEAGEATQEMENIVSTNALGQLKAIFGGNPTEGERKILLQIQGSASQPDAVRQKIFDRGIALAQRHLEFNQRRAEDLKGGTFYKAEGKDAPRASGSPPSLPVKVTPSMKPEDIVKRFPSGTRLILPDGSEGRVP
ncbi:hypothetical protein [Methylorubrum extorquens]|uniref:Transglycosylase SLT domain-containing protein n=1 Tax=Methylorubrum extorquens TaxID=408 RepID=A0AAX3WDB3_METEX|nr:hypothetical protein [Methylorubrum extorquens]WHQ69474.1 hypothetical protein KEC54_24560 [Methylorubrum extorquens]